MENKPHAIAVLFLGIPNDLALQSVSIYPDLFVDCFALYTKNELRSIKINVVQTYSDYIKKFGGKFSHTLLVYADSPIDTNTVAFVLNRLKLEITNIPTNSVHCNRPAQKDCVLIRTDKLGTIKINEDYAILDI